MFSKLHYLVCGNNDYKYHCNYTYNYHHNEFLLMNELFMLLYYIYTFEDLKWDNYSINSLSLS